MKHNIWSAAVILAAGVLSTKAATIYTQGFNSATIPADWATEIVSQPGVAPAITFVTASTYPAGFAPYEGTHFVRFNSYNCLAGSSIRLKRTAGLSTLGYAGVMVQFAWARDTGYSSRNDSVTVQYSTNGTTWVSAGTYVRPGTGSNHWEVNTCMLPAGAAGKATVYIAFLFTSDYGNDCHVDAVNVLSADSAPPDAFAATGLSVSQINLTWALNAAGHTVLIASNGVDVFGAPASGTVYNVGNALPGGGGIIYKGTGTAFAHTGLAPETLRHYRAWSVNAATQYSDSVAASARTFPAPISVFPYHESFESGWGAWRASDGFDFAWERWQGQTPTDGTGPNRAHDGIWYAYTESSSPNYPGKTAGLYAHVSFAGVARPALDFYYHMHGATMGTLAVDVFDGVWRTGVWSVTGPQQTSATAPWLRANVPLFSYAQSNMLIRFRGVTGNDYLSDMAIDAIRLYHKTHNVYLWPEVQSGAGTPGSAVTHTLLLENDTPAANVFVFNYTGAWPANGPAATSAAVPAGGTTTLVVSVTVPATVIAGEASTTSVRAISADTLYTNTATLITRCTWTYERFSEPFDTWPNGWTNYASAGATPWYHDVFNGNPLAPCVAHDQDPITGVVSWLVSPAIDLSMPGIEQVLCTFYFGALGSVVNEGLYVSAGARDPLAGDYVKASDFGHSPSAWVLNTHDLSAYRGINPVYLGFLYRAPNPAQFLDTITVTGYKVGIDNATLVSPPAFAITSYQGAPAITGSLFIAGETGLSIPASHVTAQFGCGPTGMAPDTVWTWADALYAGAAGSNDLYVAAPQITVAGALDYAFRFRRGDGSWVYADLDGSTNGYSSARAGKAAVAPLPPQGGLLIQQTINPLFTAPINAFVWPTNLGSTYAEVADDISLPYDAWIRSLRWAGQYSGDGRQAAERGFWMRIYADSNGVPGTLLHQQFRQGYACEEALDATIRYTYHGDLDVPFLMHAGQRYWFSIQDEVLPYSQWRLAPTADPVSGALPRIRASATGEWTATSARDVAVEIYGVSTNAGVLAGTVTAAHSGSPINNAAISATNAMHAVATATAANGTYAMTLPAGTYTVRAAAPNYVSGTAAGVVITPSSTTMYHFALAGSVLTYGPSAIVERMQFGERVTNTVYVTNSGPLAVSYSVRVAGAFAQTNLSKRAALPAVRLPRFKGVIERTPPRLGPPPDVASDGTHAVALSFPAAYPDVLCYGFYISLTPNQLISFMTAAPGVLLTNLPAPGISGNFVTGADFLGGNLNTLYGITFASGLFFSINVADASTNIIAIVPPPAGQNWTGMAASPDGMLYVCSTDLSISHLYAINPASGALTFVGVISNCPCSIDIAVNANGEMYAVDLINNNLVKIDRTTGAGAIVGSIGFDANFAQDMDFDDENDILYLAAYNNNAGQRQLRAADVTTGNTTNLGALAASIDGFAIATASMPPWLSLSTNAGTLAAGGASSFNVVFDAGAVSNGGLYRADLGFAGTFVNGPPGLPLSMIIATAPIISAPATVACADTVVGEAFTQTFAVANIGIGVLTGAVSGAAAPFSIASPTDYIIPADSSVTMLAIFTPAAEGGYTNVLALSGGGGTTVTLLGSGVPEPLGWLLGGIVCLGAMAARRALR